MFCTGLQDSQEKLMGYMFLYLGCVQVEKKILIHKSNYKDQITSSIMDFFVIHTGSILKVFFDALE